ncbi:hypothetical protein Pst134EA_031660 [Puccinia striiformis f. sp. tritici]|uniref:uncharacterized protein n=1 Tax=Puccinia striiformis f. sp. tritici TaxID=168172 RepID=UPI00200771F7|nr:uncharacterized protein Pst134EA_031660 [Puccinia striiformis f. sp. tritici]KAH9442691.1 hypothetical protein Pst134EA_031660 [Puccinia striiformis f. sp. tritici]
MVSCDWRGKCCQADSLACVTQFVTSSHEGHRSAPMVRGFRELGLLMSALLAGPASELRASRHSGCREVDVPVEGPPRQTAKAKSKIKPTRMFTRGLQTDQDPIHSIDPTLRAVDISRKPRE